MMALLLFLLMYGLRPHFSRSSALPLKIVDIAEMVMVSPFYGVQWS